MKKILLLLALFTATSFLLKAQVRFGPEVGGNVAHYKLDAGFFAFSASSKPGVILGAIVEIPLSSHLYLRPGARYVSTSYDLNYTVFTLTGTINTIQLPVNLVYKTGSDDGNRFYISAGPYFAMNIVAEEHITASKILSQWGVPENLDSVRNLSTGDLGIGASAGYQFGSHFLLQAHFQKSYGHLFFDVQGVDVKNYNYGLSLAYLFGGGSHRRY